MLFDLETSLRTLRPQKRASLLERRAASDLQWAVDEPLMGGPLLLDTCVYIDVLQGRTPPAVDELLTYRLCNHSAVCLAELTHIFGRLDPAHPATKSVLRTVRQTIEDIPSHRLHAPQTGVWGQAGMLAGELVRRTGLSKLAEHKRRFLNDALIHAQARALGASVLTGNIVDFDYLNQIVPSVRVIVYQSANAAS